MIFLFNGKIGPKLAESLASDFEEIGSINEGFLDSIKNTLSKTFLGSLSHINMIDQSRQIIVKAKKELLTKRYAHEDEIESLNNKLKQALKSGDTATSDTIKKTILNKENEYKTYAKMINKGIEKSEATLEKVIEGNRRRREYCEAGQSEDELEIAELEYKLAKGRSEADPKKIKDLEEDIKKRKEEAQEAQEKLKKSEEEAKDKKEDPESSKQKMTPSGSKLFRDLEDMQNRLDKLNAEISDLEHQRIDGTITSGGKIDLAKKKELRKDYKDRLREAEKKLRSKRKPMNKNNNATGLKLNVNNFTPNSQTRAAAKK
jgi:chromosome segregation ATPase